MEKKLYCGACRMKITPSKDLWPNLRGPYDTIFGGVLDDLYVRVIAFSDEENKALIISFDLSSGPNPKESFAAIFERTGIPEDNILFLGIHTHSAPGFGVIPPGTYTEPNPNDFANKPVEVQEATKRYEEFLMKTMLRAVDEAITGMQPAKMGYGYGESYINVNRNQDYVITDENGKENIWCGIGVNPEKPVDRTLFVMRVEELNGKPIAFFVNYAMHNVVMIWNRCGENGKSGISSDIGGNVSQYLEAKFEGSVAIWSSGAAGDVNPIMSNEIFYPDPMTGRSVAYHIGGRFDLLNEDARKLTYHPIVLLKTLSTRHFADVLKVVRNIDRTSDKTSIACTVAWSKTPGRDKEGQVDAAPFEVRLHLVRIGDVALYGIGGELFSSFGRRIKEISPMKNTVVINHDASQINRIGYIIDDEMFKHFERIQSGYIPGITRTRLLPGYFFESLEKHTLDMFDKVM